MKRTVSEKTPSGSKRNPRAGMLFSMTGFGTALTVAEGWRISVEVRSVNSRFLDLTLRGLDDSVATADEVRGCAAGLIMRGRLEISVKSELQIRAEKNQPIFSRSRFLRAAKEAADILGVPASELGGELRGELLLSAARHSEVPERVKSPKSSLIVTTVQKALQQLVISRVTEGRVLGSDISNRLKRLEQLLVLIEKERESVAKIHTERLHSKLHAVLSDKNLLLERVAAEVAFLVERSDITEEIVRLKSHFKRFREYLGEREVGRKLDFLLQEMGREWNTVASKAGNSTIQHAVVDAKVELEKIREQVQNLE